MMASADDNGVAASYGVVAHRGKVAATPGMHLHLPVWDNIAE